MEEKQGLLKLELLHSSQSTIDMGAGELAHIFFSLQVSWETALAGEFDFVPVFKIDMTAPCPCIGIRIFSHYTDEWLIAMGILDSIPLAVFWGGLHSATVVVVAGYSKHNARLCRSSEPSRLGSRAVYELPFFPDKQKALVLLFSHRASQQCHA